MKLFSKALCIFLSAVMLLYLIPNEAYNVVGSAAEQFAKADDATEPQAEVIALDEEISKRTASTKTIRMSDGSYRLVQYANDVHYEDNGEWVEYDNSLTLSTASTGDASLNGISKAEPPALKTADNPSGLKFGQSSSDKLVSFTNDNKKLEMSIVGNSKNSYAVQQIQTADFVPADRFEELTAIENYSSSVMYSNVFDNAHIKYTAAGNQVKEEIVVIQESR